MFVYACLCAYGHTCPRRGQCQMSTLVILHLMFTEAESLAEPGASSLIWFYGWLGARGSTCLHLPPDPRTGLEDMSHGSGFPTGAGDALYILSMPPAQLNTRSTFLSRESPGLCLQGFHGHKASLSPWFARHPGYLFVMQRQSSTALQTVSPPRSTSAVCSRHTLESVVFN